MGNPQLIQAVLGAVGGAGGEGAVEQGGGQAVPSLHLAALMGNYRAMCDSLAAGDAADILLARDEDGATPLHLTIIQQDVVPDQNVEDPDGLGIERFSETLYAILDAIPHDRAFDVIRERDTGGSNALHFTIETMQPQTLNALLERVPQDRLLEIINEPNPERFGDEQSIGNLLHFAATTDAPFAIETILDRLGQERLPEPLDATEAAPPPQHFAAM